MHFFIKNDFIIFFFKFATQNSEKFQVEDATPHALLCRKANSSGELQVMCAPLSLLLKSWSPNIDKVIRLKHHFRIVCSGSMTTCNQYHLMDDPCAILRRGLD